MDNITIKNTIKPVTLGRPRQGSQPIPNFGTPLAFTQHIPSTFAPVMSTSVKEGPSVGPSSTELPKRIEATYNRDYNIKYLHGLILKKLHQEKSTTLPELCEQLKKQQALVLTTQTYIARKISLDEIKTLETRIRNIESGQNIVLYQERVKVLLEEYGKRGGKINTVSIDSDVPEEEEDITLLRIIEDYLDIAREYFDISIRHISNNSAEKCYACQALLVNAITVDDGCIVYSVCNAEYNTMASCNTSKDSSRININNVEDDESIENFMKTFMRYQGLQPENPPQKLYEELDEYFVKRGLPIGSEVSVMSLDRWGKRGDTNIEMLKHALSSINRSEYLEDMNLIGKEYWNWKLPELMHLQAQLIDHYNKTQVGFYQIPAEEKERSSSLGTQWRLWKQLVLLGHECRPEDFKIPKNTDSLRQHEKLWRKMCELADDPEIRYIP